MDYLKTNLKWEDFFATESAELQEKMQSLDMDTLSKSKLRLAVENNILDWNKYESWVLEHIGCASLKPDIPETVLESLAENLQNTLDAYSAFDCWSEDLLPVLMWDSQVIVFGLQYNEKLVSIPNHIFILAPPELLTLISKKISKDEEKPETESKTANEKADATASGIEGLAFDLKPLSFDFKDLSRSNTPSEQTNTAPLYIEQTHTKKIDLGPTDTNTISATQFTNSQITAEGTKTKSEKEIWEFINERHNEYSFEVKKQFTAYLVLKVDYDKTRVYKMDPDLAAENVNEQLFNYSLREENPFKRVFESGQYESFSVSQLGLNLKNFKYACITALICGKKVVGFLVGFKDKNLSEIDQMLLEELAKETAA